MSRIAEFTAVSTDLRRGLRARDVRRRQLHAWLWPRLDASERQAVTEAVRQARAELVVADEAPELHSIVGLPDRAAATAMLAELDATVWAAI